MFAAFHASMFMLTLQGFLRRFPVWILKIKLFQRAFMNFSRTKKQTNTAGYVLGGSAIQKPIQSSLGSCSARIIRRNILFHKIAETAMQMNLQILIIKI